MPVLSRRGGGAPRHLLIECDAVKERRVRIFRVRTEELPELDILDILQLIEQLELESLL